MNTHTVTGKFEQVAGKIKQSVGEATDNQSLANEGVMDQIKGATRETWGHAKDAANAVADKAHREREDTGADIQTHSEAKASQIRENIAETTQKAKNAVTEKLDAMKHRNEA